MTRASWAYSAEFLAGCTMYASAEPCAMCAGSAYWAGGGRVVYGLSEREMGKIIGPHPENLTMDLACPAVPSWAPGNATLKLPVPCWRTNRGQCTMDFGGSHAWRADCICSHKLVRGEREVGE
jgi:hypothetical protein